MVRSCRADNTHRSRRKSAVIRSRTTVYLIITAASAACGLIIEIAAGRMIAPYLGMSLYTWTAIIAVVLAGFSLGHWVGGRISEQSAEDVRFHVAASLLLAAVSTAASLLLIRLLAGPVINLGMAPVPTILVITMALFFLPSFFVGIPSPALTKLAIDEQPERIGRILGAFFAAGALGSIGGTLAAGFLFISWLGTIGTYLAVAAAFLVMGLVMLLIGRDTGRGKAGVLLVVVVLACGALGALGARVNAFVSPCETESDYYCIRVAAVPAGDGRTARAMVLDHLGHGINLRDTPRALLTPYVEMQDNLARIHSGRRSPFRAFFIGGGAYTLPRAWLAARPDAEITVAEIDPAVTRTAIASLWLIPDKRLRVRHQDARRALREMPTGTLDVIVGDAFHDITMPQHLATREFFASVKSRLMTDGIYLMNVVDHHDRPRLAISILATLQTVFPVVELWRSDEQGRRSTFVLAGLEHKTPYSRIASRASPGTAFARVGGAEIKKLKNSLAPLVLTDDFAPVDRLIGVR